MFVWKSKYGFGDVYFGRSVNILIKRHSRRIPLWKHIQRTLILYRTFSRGLQLFLSERSFVAQKAYENTHSLLIVPINGKWCPDLLDGFVVLLIHTTVN